MTYYHLGLVGFPLEHSLSPQIHMAALKAQHLEGRYDLFPFPPTSEGFEGIQSLIEQMHRGDLHGLNVTIPHKITLIPYLDRLTPISRAIGAVNALRLEGDELVGDNFDCASFLADLTLQLKQAGLLALCQRPGRSALVLGAGGSARAVVYGLLSQGWQVSVASRQLAQAQELVHAFSLTSAITCCDLDGLASSDVSGFDLIVNATPLGMHPGTGASPWPDGLPFPSAAFVYDLVYTPSETALLRSARSVGLPTANGLGMLVRQAAMSFCYWTGQEPPMEVMYGSINFPKFQYKPSSLPPLKRR